LLAKRLIIGKISVSIILFIMFFGLLMIFDSSNIAYSESLTSIYEQVKDKYPEEIEKMKRYGASDSDIEDFITALEEKLREEDNISEESVDNDVIDAVIDLYLEGEHITIFDAVQNGWNLNQSTLMNAFMNGGAESIKKLLPKSFIEIGRLVKEELMDPPDEPNPTPGNGGGGSGVVTEDNSITLVDSAEISRQLSGAGKVVALTLSAEKSTMAVKDSDLEKLIATEKTLEIKSPQGDVVFSIPGQTLNMFKDTGLKITAQKLSSSDAEKITKQLSSGSKRVSPIYELNLQSISEEEASDGNLDQPIKVSISYAESFLTLKEEDNLAVYRYDEEKGQWFFVGGTIDKDKKTIEWQASHFSKYTILSGGPGITFADISTHWAKSDIEYLATRGIVNGVKEDTFEPNRKITRAEFVKMLVNILNLDTNETSNKAFTDVAENSWYYRYVAAASNAGLVNGVSETLFAPNSPITRQEMAVMATNSLKIKNKLMASIQEKESELEQFKDVSEISHWAKDACLAALEDGIITGRGAELLAPKDDTTRAESAVIIKRILSKL